MENINSPCKGRDLLLADKPRIVPWGTKRMPQRIQRHTRTTLQRSLHHKRKQEQRGNLALEWSDYRKNSIWYGSAKLDDKLPQNIPKIRWRHKFSWENHENLESRIDCWRKKLSWSKGLKRYFSRRCTITVTIHYFHLTSKMHSWT